MGSDTSRERVVGEGLCVCEQKDLKVRSQLTVHRDMATDGDLLARLTPIGDDRVAALEAGDGGEPGDASVGEAVELLELGGC